MMECFDLQNLKGKGGKNPGKGKGPGTGKNAYKPGWRPDYSAGYSGDGEGWVQPMVTDTSTGSVPLFMLTCDQDTSSLMQVNAPTDDGWECLESMVDSGAARSVCPMSVCPENGLLPSRSGPEYFRTATGDKVQNHGLRRIQGCATEGVDLTLMYNVADVSTPLDSVSQICDKGNIVVFTSTGGYICGPHGKLSFKRRNDTYVRQTWVRKPRDGATGGRKKKESNSMEVDFLRPDSP